MLMIFIIVIVPFIIYLIVKILSLILNISPRYFLAIYYFVLFVVGMPLVTFLKNRIVSFKFVLKLYTEVLDQIPHYIDFLYYKACLSSAKKNKKQCLIFLKKILDIDKNYKENIERDEIFHVGDLSHSTEFKELLRNYEK